MAYRIARIFQDKYETFTIFVAGYCKSAGTLCVLGAHELVMADLGELGPLDVQISKKDELGDFSSGLVTAESLAQLQSKAFDMFERYFMTIKNKGGGHITFKTATEIAVKLSIGLMEPLYRQVDPIQVGEIARSMKIGRDYGQRLSAIGNNLTPSALETLIASYPSHGFVIDRNEAAQLFTRVREPSPLEMSLIDSLGDLAITPIFSEKAICAYLNDEPTSEIESNSDSGENHEHSIENSSDQSQSENTSKPGGDSEENGENSTGSK